MIRGTDFILNPAKCEEEFQLVEIMEWIDFNSKKKLGFYYTVLFPKLKYEKIKVGVKGENAIVTKEELEEKGQIPIKFEGLSTWASLYNGHLTAKAEATNVKRAGAK